MMNCPNVDTQFHDLTLYVSHLTTGEQVEKIHAYSVPRKRVLDNETRSGRNAAKPKRSGGASGCLHKKESEGT